MVALKTLSIFLLAGVCEIGGGYMVWLWLREGKSVWTGILGLIMLALYGVVATWQPASFGRVYAAYGGIFIILSLMWAWKVDNFKPDRYDIMGSFIVLIGIWMIFYAPRNNTLPA